MLSGVEPVLFEAKNESNAQPQEIISEKKAPFKNICDKHQGQPKQWIEEKKLLIETNMHSWKETKELQKQVELLSAKLSSTDYDVKMPPRAVGCESEFRETRSGRYAKRKRKAFNGA
uniref:Cwf21 domain-containing protein n=1 Tax=Angiostrongylus cantonensis TaxID=6313 RepID=A0A0K0D7U0_ANGCA